MMTIKAPIELKVRSDYMHGYDAFGERIAGNYALMGLEIGEEELLHMVSSPPEIYLADGGSTTIGGNTFISSRNEEKYSIVNNMLNRILLSVNGELTYQDRTYITDALHKLGIKDDRKFMTEVRKMIDESHLEETFLNNYFEMVLGDERRELREETLKLSKELAKKEIYHTERSRENYLSESILHRLQTGAIYQIVSNFNRSLNDTRIELQESMLSEQENVARKLLVQSFLTNVVKEEPELFHADTGRTEAGEGPVQVIREIRSGSPERSGEFLREEETRYYEQSEREFRESEQQRLERESALRSEYETAEIIYREGEGKEQAEVPGTAEERVIIERTRGSEPGTVEQRTTERIITGQESTAQAASGKEEAPAPVFGERVISEERPGESVTERVTEESSRITERRDSDHSIESRDHYITEREENFRTDREKAELVYREGGEREAFEETILDRLSEQIVLDRERLRERQDTERISTERIEGSLPGQEIRTDRVTSETIRQEERERRIPGETITERTSERVLREEELATEHTDTERSFEHTDRYVTEQGEILRTEHEGAEIFYRQEQAAGEAEEGAEQGAAGSVRETSVIERERYREAGEVPVSEQRIPGAPAERVTETERREALLESAEYRSTERLTAERETVLRSELERIERLREAGRELTVEEERLRERLIEQLAQQQAAGRERSGRDTLTERTERYVTEAGEVLRTEHEGAELIYREGEAPEPETGELQAPGTSRETTVTERERYREAGEPLVTEQRIPGTPGEAVTEIQRREALLDHAEYRITERLTTERESVLRAELERLERLREAGRELTVEEERLRERLIEQLAPQQAAGRERAERDAVTERTERYVTEAGEVLRTEHEGAELIYREGELPESETGELQAPGTLRETTVTERERYREAGEPFISEQRIPGTPGERVTETERREALQQSTEYRSTERLTAERETVLRSELERIERLREAGRELTVEEERLRERLIEILAPQQAAGRDIFERKTAAERTERYVTETGEVLRTEHEGAELIYREGELPESEAGELQTPGTLRETTVTERERYREAGEPSVSEQRIPGTPGEAVTEIQRREALRERAEYGTTERLTTERETVLRAELERLERIREAGRELTVEEERLRERLTEQLRLESTAGREIFERETAAERTERYVTETGEVLRTEHEGAELIYREGELPESEAGELQTPGTLRETRESERERISERERLEKERSSSVTREETFSDIRSELREKLESERIRTEQLRAGEAGGYGSAPGQAELIYREGTPAEERYPEEGAGSERIREILEKERERRSETERLEKERSSYIRETAESSVREEILEQLRTEQLRTERYKEGETPAPGRTYERSELIYRQPETAGEDAAAVPERNIREVERYRSDNVYERELLETERSRTEVTTGLAAAVLLDVVKTLFHAGYDRIGKGDSWIEYRGALYHSAENIFNRLNYDLEQRLDSAYNSYAEISSDLSLSHAAFEELQEITENAGDVQTIENTIREMNEMNLQNVDRYEQMIQVLKTLRPERKRTGGLERTRKEALSLLDDEKALYENLQHAEDAREEERREVFHEISRIFPENSVEIFKVVEQYLDGTVQPGKVGVTRNNVEAAAEEIRRITSAPAVVQEPLPEPAETESSELIYRRNDRMTQEELQEMFENIRRSENLQLREIEQKDQRYETDRRSTTTLMSNTERTLTRQDAEDIEALVSRGVRSQMSAISEQVLQKLEKKLKNEKIRRGI